MEQTRGKSQVWGGDDEREKTPKDSDRLQAQGRPSSCTYCTNANTHMQYAHDNETNSFPLHESAVFNL